MPPRSTRAKTTGTGTAASASTTATADLPIASSSSGVSALADLRSQVASALSSWDADQQSLKTVLANRAEEASSSKGADLSSLPLSYVFIQVLESGIEAEPLAEFLKGLVDGWEEGKQELLWETMVDVVEVLDESREDCDDLLKAEEGMEVDGQVNKGKSAGAQKGIEVVKLLLASETLPPHIPNLLLSPHLLLQLDLHPTPHNPGALQRAYVKRNTTLFYKQSKYNLLRESSEGFSGLIVLLTGPDALSDHIDSEDDTKVRERASRVWSKVMGLIGYFNLSPPRVLDLILEVASKHVAAHWRFWLDLLRCSPWGSGESSGKGKGKGKEKALREDWVDEEVRRVGEVLDWDGDRVLAQVLGVKFGFYQRQDGGDTPRGLVFIAALLIKHGFIGMSDLLPFLTPDDAEMENIHERYMKSVSSRSGPANALSSSVLVDDDEPNASAAKEGDGTAPPPKPPPEQRIQLLQALLAIGDIPAAQYFLSKFPWTVQSNPQIADLILRIVGYALEGVYRSAVPGFELFDEGSEAGIISPTLPRLEKEIIPTLYAPSQPETPTKIFKFFYPAWRDEIETWSTWEDIHDKGLRWLSLVRGLGGRATGIMVKICRIGAAHFSGLRKAKEAAAGLPHGAKTKTDIRSVEPTEAELEPWLKILRIALLPALSASSCTAAFDIELWNLLRFFPYPVRYQLYGEWRDFTCTFNKSTTCPIAAQAAAECTRDIKKALSRVTASQSGPGAPTAADRGPARALAKLSHTNPIALWSTAVTQVKAYPNIGASIVEAGRYMTQLSMDVAMFTLVDVLSDEVTPRLNPQGTEVAQWLENIASFVGDFNRRYAMMDLEPVLQFIINRLMRGDSGDLTILSRLVQRMYGVDTVENNGVSDAQLEAYGTGREMVHEAFWATRILLARPSDDPTSKPKEAPVDKAKSTKKSLPRLINALRDTHLALPIWIALAQTRQGVVDKLAWAPLKAMGLMQDKVHDIFIQFGDLLSEQLTPDELIALTPDFSALCADFGLDYSMAFQIVRPRLTAELEKVKAAHKEAVAKRLQTERTALNLKLNSPTRPASPLPSAGLASPTLSTMQLDGDEGSQADEEEVKEEVIEEAKDSNPILVPAPRTARKRAWWPVALTKTMRQVRDMLPQSVNEVMSAAFFVIYWHLSISDIAFSAETYASAINRINAYEKDVASWRVPNVTEQKAERARLKARAEVLAKERDVQSAFVNGPMKRRLRLESPRWFGKVITEKNQQKALSTQLHQYCFYPRALLTPADSVFVAKFIRTMHDLGTLGYSTVFAYNNFFSDQLAACFFACTESEARNLARCLKAMLTDLDAWHQDEAKFKREALGETENSDAPSTLLPGMQFRPKTGMDLRPMTWPEFRNFTARCHAALSRALVACWSETDFMHVKNGITVALQVLPIFPLVDTHGQAIEAALETLRTEKSDALTPDLQQGCAGYATQLKKRLRDGRAYVTAAQFHGSGANKAAAPKAAPSAPRSTVEENAPRVNGSPAPAAKSTSLTDQEALRQKVKETRARTASAALAAKGEAKSTPASPAREQRETPPTSTAAQSEAKTQPTPPPAGPRATRSTASVPPVAPTGPSSTTKANGAASPEKPPIPTGPAKGLSALPQKPGSQNMPPPSLSIDEERAAARARKFGTMLSQPLPAKVTAAPASSLPMPTSATPSAPATASAAVSSTTTTIKAEEARRSSPASSRKPSPSPTHRSRRSHSTESRLSERSKRERRDQEDRERDRARAERRNGDSAKSTRGDSVSRAQTPSERKGGDSNDKDSRQRQEDLLQARHDKLASEERRETRRSSRDSARDAKRDDEKEKDKDERRSRDREDRHDRDRKDDKERNREKDKVKEREKQDKEKERERDRTDKPRDSERERERTSRDDAAGAKRKRDEEPRRIDPIERPGDRRRDERREDRHRDRDRDRDRERDADRRDPRRDDPREDPRDRRRDSRDPRDARDVRNTRDDDRERDRERERRSRRGSKDQDPPVREARQRSPERSRDSKSVLPPAATVSTVTAPRLAPSNGHSGPAIDIPKDLPSKPSGEKRSTDISTSGHSSLPPRPSLAERMGPLNNGSRSPVKAEAAPISASQPANEGRVTRSRDEQRGGGEEDKSAEPRKRPLEGASTPSREESPGASKRIKIDRDKARSHDRKGREAAGGNRLLAGAMRAANDK